MTTSLIKTENYEIKGVPFVRTYSDENRYVVRDGVSYEEANDPAEFGRIYTEGGVIQTEESEAEDLANAARILFGEEET